MNLSKRAALTLLLCSSIFLQACEEKSSGEAPLQPPAELPAEFVDDLGTTWLCDTKEYSAHVAGRVIFDTPPVPLRTDLLHMTLLQRLDGQLTSVSSYCINNITRTPIAFTMGFDESLLNSGAEYSIAATYFEHVAGNLYSAIYKRDGETPVISNGVTEGIDIRLQPTSSM